MTEPAIFQIDSQSHPGEQHRVILLGSAATCDCPGYRFHGRCRHLREAAQRQAACALIAPLRARLERMACTMASMELAAKDADGAAKIWAAMDEISKNIGRIEAQIKKAQ